MNSNDHEANQVFSDIAEDVQRESGLVETFPELAPNDIINVLESTIKSDNINKITTFMCFLSAYTEDSQFNISFNAPSSTGKSYIPLQISGLFPKEDVLKLSYASPTAFFHDMGEYDKETGVMRIDLSRKVIVFLDQPHNDLLARLRPLLSHDEKEIIAKITDKGKKGGIRTKTLVLIGFPSVVFCTAGLNIDEQEATRFFLLSPEISQEKLRSAIYEKIKKEADSEAYFLNLDGNDDRNALKARIAVVRDAHVDKIRVPMWNDVNNWFLLNQKKLKPRHQRDVNRLMALIKMFALLNFMHRERIGDDIVAAKQDFEHALQLWEQISVSQEYCISPYVYDLYHDVIIPCWKDLNGELDVWAGELSESVGIPRQRIVQKHYDVYGRMISPTTLRQQILPVLETSGLIIQEADINDKRKALIYPTTVKKQRNSEQEGGLK